MEYLDAPMREADLLIHFHEHGYIDVVVAVELGEIIDNDLDGFDDILCDRIGSILLSNLKYEVVGNKSNILYIRVQCDASNIDLDTHDWTVDECKRYIHYVYGSDIVKESCVLDNDVNGWRNYVMTLVYG